MNLEPFDPELVDMLREEARRPEPSDDVKAAVRAALRATLDAPAPGPHAPDTTPSPARSAARGIGDLGRGGRLLGAVGLVGLGGILGAIAHARFGQPEIVYRDRIVTMEAKGMDPTAVEAPLRSTTPSALPSANVLPTTPTLHRPSPPVESTLSAERRVLEIAAAALGRGEAAAALDAAERHTREFPKGQLEEEREALAVQALARLGRSDDAVARSARFRTRFPDSPFLPSIDAVLPH